MAKQCQWCKEELVKLEDITNNFGTHTQRYHCQACGLEVFCVKYIPPKEVQEECNKMVAVTTVKSTEYTEAQWAEFDKKRRHELTNELYLRKFARYDVEDYKPNGLMILTSPHDKHFHNRYGKLFWRPIHRRRINDYKKIGVPVTFNTEQFPGPGFEWRKKAGTGYKRQPWIQGDLTTPVYDKGCGSSSSSTSTKKEALHFHFDCLDDMVKWFKTGMYVGLKTFSISCVYPTRINNICAKFMENVPKSEAEKYWINSDYVRFPDIDSNTKFALRVSTFVRKD